MISATIGNCVNAYASSVVWLLCLWQHVSVQDWPCGFHGCSSLKATLYVDAPAPCAADIDASAALLSVSSTACHAQRAAHTLHCVSSTVQCAGLLQLGDNPAMHNNTHR